MQTVLDLQKIATQIRRDVLRMVHGAKSGHPGGALGSADFLVALYFSQMQHQAHPFAMDAKAEDTFTLSNGHLSALYYSVLARSGYFPLSELATFRQIHSRLQGHPTTAEHLPGIRVASGSLGQGISFAIGIAQTKKLNHDKTISYCLCGDGELQEGQIWEALMYAAAKKVDNIILTIDVNGQQIDGSTDEVLSLGDLSAKFTAFAWHVFICDGNNMKDLLTTLQKAKEKCFQQVPVVILMQTLMGKGVDFMMSGHHWHGKAPNDAQLQEALAQLEETLGDY